MRRDGIDIVEIGASLPEGFDCLRAEAKREEHEFLDRMQAGFGMGSEAYEGAGEGAFVAYCDSRLAGTASIAFDPFLGDPRVGRIRHVFVSVAARRQGVAAALVSSCLERGHDFALIRLRTGNPDAARLYERLGFVPAALADATHIYRPPISSVAGTSPAVDPPVLG
jgi:GNAT superfamily N-acetyltransferase